jgi:DegV family protein with EDD domain
MVHIISDTTACIPQDVINQYKIPLVPQIVNFGNESFREGIDIDYPEFLQKLKTSREMPKTAAPPIEMFTDLFTQYAADSKPILCIHPSSDVSGTVRSATVAAQDFPNLDIRIFDTRSVAGPLGVMVGLAAQWSAEGKSADEIIQHLDIMKSKARIFFTVETLDFLAKGGRIGGASALIGTLLQIKPILTFKEGHVDQYDRERTHKRAIQHLKRLVIEQTDRSGQGYPTVFHADVESEATEIAQELAAELNISSIPVFNMPPAIVSHVGPHTIGVGFFVA